MNSKLIEYLNKTRNGKKDNIRAILFSEDTITYYYLFDINMENNVLTISGKRDTETTDEKNGYKRVERVTGTFHRRFTLPDSIDSDHITAKTDNGVLEITLPKQAKVMPRKIAVQAPAPAANNTISTTSTSAAA